MSRVIKIDTQGQQVTANVRIEGLVSAAYRLRLFEANSNVEVISTCGHNQNDDDDKIVLPNSPVKNAGRVITVDALAENLNDEIDGKTWSIHVEIIQDGELRGVASKVKALSEGEQAIFMLIKLAAL